jgi:hypothetical protein
MDLSRERKNRDWRALRTFGCKREAVTLTEENLMMRSFMMHTLHQIL